MAVFIAIAALLCLATVAVLESAPDLGPSPEAPKG